MGGVVFASALLVAAALAAGMHPGRPWLVEAVVVTALVQGVLAGRLLPRYWKEEPAEEIFGAGGRYVGFLALVAFAAVEAHAVGAGLGSGAPGAAAALLAPPVVLAAIALRGARKKRRERGDGTSESMPGPMRKGRRA